MAYAYTGLVTARKQGTSHRNNPNGAPNQPDTEDQDVDQGEKVFLDFDDRGKIYRRSQVDDYMHRGTLASSYNVLDYFVDTYEQAITQQLQDLTIPQDVGSSLDGPRHEEPLSQTNACRRPIHTRIKYMDMHPRSRTHMRVIRPDTHKHMPNIIGPRFPRRSDPTQADIYAACILVFLKPWRRPEDIKKPEQTWPDALNEFLSTASERTLDILDNIEHKHQSQAAAEDRQQASFDPEDEVRVGENMMEVDEQDAEVEPNQSYGIANSQITQEMLEKAEFEMENYREVVHGVQAVRIGEFKGMFSSRQVPVKTCGERTSEMDMRMLKSWFQLLKQDAEANCASHSSAGAQATNLNDNGTVEPLPLDQDACRSMNNQERPLPTNDEPAKPIPDEELFEDQQRAFGVLRWHLTQTLRAQERDPSQRPPQLRMLLIGEGGTGKSRVIQTISSLFKRLGVENKLVKAAFTGCAASHIEGQTTHSIARIVVGSRGDTISNASKQEMTRTWQLVEYLIIDEYSMLSKEFLAQLSRRICIAKLGRNPEKGDLPFGGVNVILCGDGHQIPPVAVAAGGALYHPATSSRFITTPEAGLGRRIYESFELVVILKQQVRVTDPVWQRFLSKFRVGQVQESDIALLDSVTLTNPHCRPTDFASDRWRDCILITPRNAVRMRWNNKSIEERCRRTGEQLLVVKALDTCMDRGTRRPIDIREKYFSMRNAGSGRNPCKGRREKNGLPDEVRVAIGMKVMVTLNLNTDIDVTNGARGVIVGIKLDPQEPPFSTTEPQIILTRLPIYILVKLDRTRANALPNLEPGVIPVVPATKNYSITIPIIQNDRQITSIKRNVRRLQFPIAPAYAFTDYRAQGQTLESAVVDIAEPPTGGKLSQPNVYVALSRCSGLDDVRILRDFDRALLRKPIDVDLVRDDERLERLNASTKEWWDTINTEHASIQARS